jgi:hypothetical protein
MEIRLLRFLPSSLERSRSFTRKVIYVCGRDGGEENTHAFHFRLRIV